VAPNLTKPKVEVVAGRRRLATLKLLAKGAPVPTRSATEIEQ
jgi:hypothetical protein